MPDATNQTATVKLRYRGPDVDDGTMELGELTDALQGFAGAYTKVGAFLDSPNIALRVSAPQRGSFELAVIAATLAQHQSQLQNIHQLWDWTKRIFDIVKDLMNLKKQAKGQPYRIEVSGDNNVVNIITAENVLLPITRETLEIHQTKIIDRDVEKIVEPLRPSCINSAELALNDKVEVTVTAEDRKYFRPEVVVFTEKPDEAVGVILSLSKQTNRGTFEVQNGHHVRYQYVGEDKYKFYSDFAYRGAVRVSGTIEYDADNKPVHIEISSVERLQAELQFPIAEGE
jgi:hypothetical protein